GMPTECERARDNIVITGQNLVIFDENPNHGTIYVIGRTMTYTENDNPLLREIVSESRQRITLKMEATAIYNNGILGVRRRTIIFNLSGQMLGQSYATSDIEFAGCNSCR